MLPFRQSALEYESSNQRPEEVPVRKSKESHGLVKHGGRKTANVSVSGTATEIEWFSRPSVMGECPLHDIDQREDWWYRDIDRPFLLEGRFFLEGEIPHGGWPTKP